MESVHSFEFFSSLYSERGLTTFLQLPPLNSKRQTEPKTQHRPKATHSKQVSIDSGVGSQSGSCHLYRQRSTSNRVKHRSISDNALLSPQFSIHEKVSHLLPLRFFDEHNYQKPSHQFSNNSISGLTTSSMIDRKHEARF